MPAQALFTPLKTEGKGNFEEVVSFQLWQPGPLGSRPPPGAHKPLGEQGMVGAHTRRPRPWACKQRTEDQPFLCCGYSVGKIRHQWCFDTRLEDYETFLHALMTSLMKGKGLNEEERNLLRILCLYLSLKGEYLFSVAVFCDSWKPLQ